MLDNTQTPTILVVDDTKTNLNILVELLGNEYDVIVALSGQSALDIVAEEKIDLILLDIMMPEMDGYEVCQQIKQDDNKKDIPIIFITAKTDEDSIEKAYDTGGRDYVTKPFKPKELLARVRTQLELKAVIEQLNFLATYEPMTEIYNRRSFFAEAEKLFSLSESLFAIMIDIDLFKSINDQYGHPIGDMVIKSVAKTIGQYIGTKDIFGRLGGEEFCIICTADNIEQVKKNAEKIRLAIADIEIITDDDKKISVTISCGISQKCPATTNLDSLLKIADDALYEAKNGGRNKVVIRVLSR